MKDYTSLTITELIDQIRQGDSFATGCLYERLKYTCYPLIRGYLRNRGLQEADAEDFFQDAFLALHKSIMLGRFKFGLLPVKSKTDQLCAFMMQTVKNLWKKRLRQESRAPVYFSDDREVEEQFELLDGLADETLEKLSDPCRELLVANFRDGISLHEIGKQRTPRVKGTEVQKDLLDCIKSYLEILHSNTIGKTTGDLQQIALLAVKEMDPKCSKILILFYSDTQKLKMDEIAKKLNYKNAHAARTAKYNCLKNLNLKIAKKMIQVNKS